MTNIQFWDVYDGGRLDHLERGAAEAEVQEWQRTAAAYPNSPSRHAIISDACAQSIAAWWHDSAWPYTTRLSTMGKVDRYLTIGDFTRGAGPLALAEWPELQALEAYIKAKQEEATSGERVGYRPCACHPCMDCVVGIPGDLCADCDDASCSATERAECEREDAYDSGEHADCYTGDCETFAPDPRDVTDGFDLPSYGD